MIRRVVSNWIGILVVGVTTIFLTPILIHRLGDFYFGMWVLVGSVLDYYGLLDLGMRWTLFRFVARQKASGHRSALDQTFATGLTISLAIGLILAVSTFILAPTLPPFFVATRGERAVFRTLVLLLGLSASATFPVQFLAAYLRGLDRFDLDNVGIIAGTLLRTGLLIAALQTGNGIIAVAVVTLVVASFSLGLYGALVRYADRDLQLVRPTWACAHELIRYSVYVFISTAGEHLRFYTDCLVIGRVLGLGMVTPFNVAARLMGYFRMFFSAINGPVMSGISQLEGRGRLEEMRRLFLRSTRITTLLSMFAGLLLILNGKAIIRVWVGSEFLTSYPVLVALTIGYIVGFAQEPCRLVIFALAKDHRLLSWWTLAEGIANLLLSIYLAHRYGLIGVAVGTTVPLVLVKLTVHPWYAVRGLRLPLWRYLSEAFVWPLIVSSIFVAIVYFVSFRQVQLYTGVLGLAYSVCWESLLFGSLAYFFVLTRSERQELNQRFKDTAPLEVTAK